ncbi:MAG: hypothetical protein WA952_10750 [Lewinella sp.]
MRHYLLASIFLLTVQLIHAQVNYKQGTVYLDGSSSLRIGTQKYSRPDDAFSDPQIPEFTGLNVRSQPVGIFVFDRLLVGARINYAYNRSSETTFQTEDRQQSYRVNPFVRYYILAGEERKWNLFAEFGFGTFGDGDLPSFETDFHVGAGVDVPLLPGVVGTARLAYNANASGLNFTTLDIGGNLLLGQLGTLKDVPLGRGTWTTQGQLAHSSFGHMRRGDDDWVDYSYSLSPSVGYFVLDGLLISSHSALSLGGTQNDISPSFSGRLTEIRFRNVQTELEVRYYPWRTTKFLPFAALALGYQSSTYSSPAFNPEDQKQESTILRAAAGVSYFLGENVALEVTAAYQRDNEFIEFDGAPLSSLRIRQLSLETGFAFYFGR